MRMLISILTIVFFTAVALMYVHQQVELVKLSYSIDCKEKKVKEMLDYKEALEYNIDNLETPSRLEHILLSQKIDVSFPRRNNVVRLLKPGHGLGMRDRLGPIAVENKVNPILGFLDIFSPKAEAQAREK